MHKATCGIYADMRLVSDTPPLPFLGLVRLKGRVRGPCSSWSLRASMKVASSMEPPRTVIPAALRLWRIFALVVASGTCSDMRSKCMKRCQDRESRIASSVPSSESPAIPHNDRIHPLQVCLSSGLLPKTLGFKVLKAHLAAHIFLLDMLEYVAVIITYPQADRHLCGYGHCVVRDILSRRHTVCSLSDLIEAN
jgi:hypothetical protein